ncbi:nuclear factor related to kappa-B-binding protein isoform X2 [Frieseomelitta varia]|uniref:nuclear factor related to kappa-B-binding protein isoform X2 n=1 Tax=Frieseomelitta varia TaxID=561572 RepID=UPI001CB6AFDE|nr:nuclear factor related to kappa-B-binding protein isoform X2 [Frieseomelitta varia]
MGHKEVDECSAGGDSGAEEDEDDASSRGSRSNSSSSSISGSSTSTDSGDDSGEEQGTSGSETHSSGEEDDEENDNTEYSVKAESPDTLKWETCIAGNTKIKLPQDLCEHSAIFKEFLDYPYIWNECLTESQRETLCNLLPVFPKDCDVEAETEKTLRMLFERENHRFGVAPLDAFRSHLSAGHYRPDIRRMCSLVRKAQQRRLLFEERKRSYELASQLLKSRESLLYNAYKQGFCQPAQRTVSKIQWRKPKPAMVEEKTQLRYLEELNALRTELGASAKLAADTTSENEENYPHYQLSGAKQKKKKRSLMGVQGLSIRGLQINHEDETIRPVFSTLQRAEYPANRSLFVREQTEEMYREMLLEHKKRRARRDIHPELNTQGIALADLTQRAQIGQKHKLSLGPAIRITSAKKRIKLEHSPLCPPAPRLTNSIKHESDNSDYSHTTDENRHSNALDMDHRMLTPIKSEPMDAYEMHQMSKKKLSPVALKVGKTSMMAAPEIKKEVEDMEYDDIKTELGTGVNEDPPLETEEEEENDKKELDLDSIDMMQLPIQLDDGIDILDDVKCEDEGVISIPDKEIAVPSNEDAMDMNSGAELMQETHSCFFSLLRDAFTSKGEYRMSAGEMKDAVTQWQGNPISPLNDWYSLASSWPALVPLALGFLAGELTYSQDISDRQEKESELVPYLENKGSGVYAWIGAGRDSDSRLSDLCAKFLMHKDSLGLVAVKQQNQAPQVSSSNVNSNTASGNANSSGRDSSSPAMESINVDGASVNTVAEWEPPRALWPTEWKVRASTMEEREEFRRQERMRYAAPHKAFTYRMHGYASVVGPVKGIYQHNVASGLTKARGHSLLVADRPNFVTILALVRDATARLPNGEGTRADICQLLKDSQYIREQTESDDKEGYLHSVVSGALDRLHYETDPCVRYYPRRKEWLYLHRARSESEFEMYHQQLQGVAKNKKNGGSMSRKALPPVIKPTSVNKEQSPSNNKEATPKKERKTASAIQPVISRKEQKKTEEKNMNDHSVTTEQPAVITNIVTTINTPTTSVISMSGATVPVTSLPTSSTSISTITVEKDMATTVDVKPQITANVPAKKATNISGKPVAVVKTSAQSLLQSNQQHFPHHQIQVSTSAGLQTIRLSGHSVLHSAQSVVANSTSNVTNVTTNLTTILPPTKLPSQQQQQSQQPQQQQQQQQQQQTIMTNQAGKNILQAASIKQQQSQQQHVLPGKTLLASQIKLVSSGQIKSLLTGHGLQGQTIFIKQSSPSGNQSQQIQQQQLKQQQQQQIQQRVVANQQQSIQTSGMQRIIAQIGGKPIAVQIQQSPHQQQQQKILAKVLTSSGSGQLISVENLLAQKGLKLATTTSHANQLGRQGKQVIQTQYQVVSQAQTSSGQSKIIASTQQQPQPQQAQTVRMVTAQLAGKPIVLASGNKNVGVGVSSSGSVVLGKQQSSQQQTQQQPIILPSQLLNIKTLHGLKVIPTPAGLKTTGAAVYARVIAPTTITSSQSTGNQQQTIQTQSSRNNTYSAP